MTNCSTFSLTKCINFKMQFNIVRAQVIQVHPKVLKNTSVNLECISILLVSRFSYLFLVQMQSFIGRFGSRLEAYGNGKNGSRSLIWETFI